MTPALRQMALAHADAEYPREACGLVVRVKGVDHYWPCRNIADEAAQFVLDPCDWAAAEDRGEIVALFHSHPDLPADPSGADIAACNETGLPWWIASYPSAEWSVLEPEESE